MTRTHYAPPEAQALADTDLNDLERTRQTLVDELRRRQRPFLANANDDLNAQLAEIDERRASLSGSSRPWTSSIFHPTSRRAYAQPA